MTNIQKPVGETATFTAVVTNAEGVVLDVPVTFTSDVDTVVVVDARDATLVGTAIETVTVTATASNGVAGSAAVDFVDNTPATVVVTAA
jgi:hypothetical protein